MWSLNTSETKVKNLSKFLYTCLVKLGENSEGVSSQGPKKRGVCGLFWHKSEQAYGFYSGLKEMSFKVY